MGERGKAKEGQFVLLPTLKDYRESYLVKGLGFVHLGWAKFLLS